MIQIVKDNKTWNNLVNECEYADSYHTFDYHQIVKTRDQVPTLIHYSEKENFIILPLLLRNIESTGYKDATSVYGYAGPLTNAPSFDFDINLFQEELKVIFGKLNLISVFSRLNPFIPYQERYLKGMGDLEKLGRIVFIDLNKTSIVQWKNYQNRLRTYINKFRTLYEVKSANTPADIEAFIDLYYETMRRLNAKNEYFFDKEYFHQLLNSPDFDAEILLAIAREGEDVAGGALFLKKNNLIQYHLSGTTESYLHSSPVKLLIDEMRIKANQENYTYFNLGGGLGANEDNLFYFKSGFSKYTLPFTIWKYIVNHSVYNDLVIKNEGIPFSKDTLLFFPRYRINDQ
ncbi:GNAT family N-acetyltransferase [Flavobacteriaceae bacterium D16]|nr:GNAT family N-acetyltransferase [Flavobacteriaceae bacterium D16]